MNTSTALPLVTAVDGHCHLKGDNYPLEVSSFTENSKTISSTCGNFKRYSRSKLLDLRNGLQSRHRPEPDLRAELQSLGVWKFTNAVNTHQNSVTTNSEGATISHSVSVSNHSVSTHLTVRPHRSPSRRDSNVVNISNSPSQHNLNHHNLHKTYIDHRSISSAHLMPAFAKRRIAASTNGATLAGFPNLSGSGNLCYDSTTTTDTGLQTPTDIKEEMSFSGINNSSNVHVRHRNKDQLNDYRHRGNIIDGRQTYLSPQRKIMEHERDRGMELQLNNGRLSSPVLSGSSRQSGFLNERRIGSGRLLPRDVNWDYQDREKTQNFNSVASVEKDILGSNSSIQFRSGVRYSDRQHDKIVGGNGYVDRRAMERRSGGGDENIREKYEYMCSTQSPNYHGNSTKRDMCGTEASLSQHTSSHNRNRRNHQYNDRNAEPEWFSSGPKSQHDTIELRGFDEIDEHYKVSTAEANGILKPSIFPSSRKVNESSSSLASSVLNLSKSKSREQLQGSLEKEREGISCVNVSPTILSCTTNRSENVGTNEEKKIKLHDKGDNNGSNNIRNFPRSKSSIESTLEGLLEKEEASKTVNKKKVNARETEVNFDVFLNPNLDLLTHTLMRGDNSNGGECDAIGTSRFSRWFGNKTVANDTKILTGGSNAGDNTIHQPVSSENKNDSNTLMEFFNKLPTLQDSGITQKVTAITSVEELEARMREINAETEKACIDIQSKKEQEMPLEIILPVNNDQSTTGQPQAGEVAAFKKLLEQLGSESKPQQQHIQPQKHIPSNMQMNVMASQLNRSALTPSFSIMQSGTVFPPTSHPQHIVLKNDDLKKIEHPSVFRQQLPNSTGNKNMSESQPIHLSMFGNQPQSRLEAQNVYQCIQHGEISIHFLEQEMNNSPLQAKEAIAAVLCDYSDVHNQLNSKSGPTSHQQRQQSPISLCSNSGMQIQNQGATNSPNEDLPQSQLQVLQVSNANVIFQGQTDRVSFLPTHQSSNHQVIPSQRDLQFQTHKIMQNPMMKKKIEEQQLQQDSHRRLKKQSQTNNVLLGPNESDMKQTNIHLSNSIQQQQLPPAAQQIISLSVQHQQRHMNSPTPLAFTPTSVLRKMTAERDNVVIQQQNQAITQNTFINFQSNQLNMQQSVATQPRMILGGNQSQQPQQMSSSNQLPPQSLSQAAQHQPIQPLRNSITPMKWPLHLVHQNMSSIKPLGRPILKGPLHPQTSSQQHLSQQQIPQVSQMMFNKLDFQQIQQQQRVKTNQSTHVLNQPTPSSFSQHSQQTSNHTNIMPQVHQQQIYQHQQRVLALQRHQQPQFLLPQQLQHQHHPPPDAPNRNICMQSANTSDNNNVTNNATAAAAVSIINYQRDGGLSPTSNQLAQWFSPELLAQASAGKLPLLNMNQALSLEEFERNMQHSSTTVHN